tara:strand:- start:46 stop:2037 length:1992 start_codon:yes stop_codon:yes gene_type:complete
MSLVVCSNQQDNFTKLDSDGGTINTKGSGTSSPATFQNHFSNVFKIEPNSEVAVQSVKIERNSVATTKNQQLSIYLGPELTEETAYEDTPCLPLPIRIPDGEYGIVQLGKVIQKAVAEKGFDIHPDYRGGTSITPNFQAAATGASFDGWNIKTSTSGNGATWSQHNNLNDITTIGVQGDIYQRSYSNPDTRITRTAADGASSWCLVKGKITQTTSLPLSLINGEFIFSPYMGLLEGTDYWEVGLTRPMTQANQAPDYYEGGFTEGSEEAAGFCDYKLSMVANAAGDKQVLVIEHAIQNDEGGFVMSEVQYFGHPTANGLLNTQITEDNTAGQIDATKTTTRYTKFKFIAKGEELILQAFGGSKNDATGTWVTIIDSTMNKGLLPGSGGQGDVATSFKPINPNCFNLYPKIGLIEQGNYVDINTWRARVASGVFPTDTNPGTSLWARTWDDDNVSVAELKVITNIDIGSLVNSIAKTATYVRKQIIASNESPDYAVAILPQSDGDLSYSIKGVYDAHIGSNSANLLGFQGQTEVVNLNQGVRTTIAGVDVADGPAAKWQIFSNQAPVFSTQTAFISIPTLTHQSLNMAKQLPSKILYQIPRFSSSGKEYGNLYFEANEKTYVKLNNSEQLNINQLQVDIVNVDETYVRDLVGQTSVVLHFRRSK